MVAALDIALIAIYFIAIAIVGYLSSRKESSQDYLIASKKLGVGANIATLSATKVTASIIITYVALVYVFGVSAIWAFIGTGIGYLLFLLFAMKLKREGDAHNYYSIADYFYTRYGKKTGMTVSIITLCILFLNFTLQLIGGAMIVKNLIGLPFVTGVLICGLIITFYLYIGGFKAVVKTDVVQAIAIIGLFVILGVFLFKNFVYNPAQWKILSAGPARVIPFLIVGVLWPFSAPDLWQRVLAAKSVKTLKKSFLWTTAIYITFGVLLTLIAIIIKLKLPAIEADAALVQGFIHLLPSGLLGAGLVALFAAIMSSADSFAFVCAGLLIHDILKKEKIAKTLRTGVIIIMVLGMLAASFFQSILDASYLFAAIYMSLSVIIIATWIKKAINQTLIVTGLITGLIFTIIFSALVGISPMLIVVGIGGTLLGLLLGGVYHWTSLRKAF
ncbi:sodium:solute symporter family protein [Candidatus Woesearchaeota archaeon]|nr:sodium:solute symporter family protein [Candidatus Woesearchaeota archaeon]